MVCRNQDRISGGCQQPKEIFVSLLSFDKGSFSLFKEGISDEA
jgi:hypothetical protein